MECIEINQYRNISLPRMALKLMIEKQIDALNHLKIIIKGGAI